MAGKIHSHKPNFYYDSIGMCYFATHCGKVLVWTFFCRKVIKQIHEHMAKRVRGYRVGEVATIQDQSEIETRRGSGVTCKGCLARM